MNLIRSLAIAGAMLTMTAAAQAQPWYVLNASTMQCVDASRLASDKKLPGIENPYRFKLISRIMGAWDNTQIFQRDAGGSPDIIAISASWPDGHQIKMLYFARMASCNRYKASMPRLDNAS